MPKRPDYRSPEAQAYRRLYATKEWKARRLDQLKRSPICEFCDRLGFVTPATVADHVEPHRGDLTAFFRGELQSLCSPCHSGVKQRIESGGAGWSSAAGLDGWPLDQNAPVNKYERERQER